MTVLSLLLAGCRERGNDGQWPPPDPVTKTESGGAKPVAVASNAPPTSPGTTIRNAAGAEVVSVAEANGSVTIKFGEQVLRGDPRDTGKRKYRIGTSAVMYEVKPNENGFKLRLADGKLLWKVKISDDKIKISDNEENANPFELKKRDDGVKVVAPGDRELGRVRGSEIENASSKTLFVASGKSSDAYGVLLLDAIPEPQRYILLAEILSRGR